MTVTRSYLRGPKPKAITVYNNKVDLVRIQRKLNSLLPERKFIDTKVGTASPIAGNVALSVHLTSVDQGTSGSERIGNHIHIWRIEWLGYTNATSTCTLCTPKESTSAPAPPIVTGKH